MLNVHGILSGKSKSASFSCISIVCHCRLIHLFIINVSPHSPGQWKRKQIVITIIMYNAGAKIYRMVLAGCVYHIRQERNLRVFQKKQRTSDIILRLVIQEVFCRGYLKSRLARRLESANLYPQMIQLVVCGLVAAGVGAICPTFSSSYWVFCFVLYSLSLVNKTS